MESSRRLHVRIRWMQDLLRGPDGASANTHAEWHGAKVPRHRAKNTRWSAGLHWSDQFGPRVVKPSSLVARPTHDLRELDERFVPRGCAALLYQRDLRCYRVMPAAHVPSPHETTTPRGTIVQRTSLAAKRVDGYKR